MTQTITYSVRRNVDAKTKIGDPAKIALCIISLPNGTGTMLAVPEGLLATIPPDKVDDFIASEVEAIIGYEVTRQ